MNSSGDSAALLTERQRKVLRGENNEISDRGERAAYARIRERIAVGLQDISLLVDVFNSRKSGLDPEDIIKQFESPELRNILISQIALFSQFLDEEKYDLEEFLDIIEESLVLSLEGEIEHLKNRFRKDDPSLTAADLSLLLEADEITREERNAYLDRTEESASFSGIPYQGSQSMQELNTSEDDKNVAERIANKVFESDSYSSE